MNDRHIIEQIRAGNQKAIDHCYTVYRNEFIYFAMKKCAVDAETARETFQEAFCAMYQNIMKGRFVYSETSIKTYLFQIGINQLSNEFRHRNRYDKSVDFVKIGDEAESSEYLIEHEQKLTIIKQTIKNMDEQCAKILKMVYWYKQKYEEVYESYGYTSVDSMKVQKYKCFKKFEVLVKQRLEQAQLM